MKKLLFFSALFAALAPPHRGFWKAIFEGSYFLMQGASAKIQAIRIAQNLPISHFWWAAGMTAAAVLMVIAYHQLTRCRWKTALKFGASLLLIRFVSFGPWLNKLRGKPFFYLGKGSVMDRVAAGWYPLAWASGALALLTFQIIKP